MPTLAPLFDLHVHSTRSDGVRSVLELAHLAKLCGLAGIAITDHDILPEFDLLRQAENLHGVRLLPGVELSTQWAGRRFHLLAYGFPVDSPPTVGLCEEILAARRARWDEMVAALRARHLPLEDSFVQRVRSQGSPGRKHLARELVRTRRASSIRVAFARYLDPLEPDPIGVDLARAISVIHQAHGKAILAHPPTGMTVDQWRALATLGLDGLETRFGRAAQRHRRFLEDRAREYGWIATAGSDYHGDSSAARLGMHTVSEPTLVELLGSMVHDSPKEAVEKGDWLRA